VINARRAALIKRGGGVRRAQVDPDVASGSELILALVDDMITARVRIVFCIIDGSKCKSLV
jgi:hypothetical protein